MNFCSYHEIKTKIDVLIIPSLYDSSPNLLFEALQNKKLVFASDISAHKEILKNDNLLFSSKNVENLVLRINRLHSSKNYKLDLDQKLLDVKKEFTFNWEKRFSRLVKKC